MLVHVAAGAPSASADDAVEALVSVSLTCLTAVGLRCIVGATTVMINAAPGSPECVVSSFSMFSDDHPGISHVSVIAAMPSGVELRTIQHVSRALFWTNHFNSDQPRGGVGS